MNELAQRLDLAQHTSRGVDVCDCQHLVFLLLQRLLDLIELGSVANWRLQLCRLDAICLEAVRERVGKVARVQNEHLIAGLYQVCRNLVPSECARAGNDNGLRGGIGGEEELAQVSKHFAEGVYEGLADMRFAEKSVLTKT
jgi:hypothetical protein